MRCQHCGGQRGLGAVSAHIYVPEWYWWHTFRFCRKSCKDSFLKEKALALERKRSEQALYHPG